MMTHRHACQPRTAGGRGPEATVRQLSLVSLITGPGARVPAILYVAEPAPTGRWHYVSPQIEAISASPPEEWCADPSCGPQRLHPDDRERVLERGVPASAAERDAPSAAEYRLLHRDGHVVWVRDDALLLFDERRPRAGTGCMSDITEHKQAEAELERRAAQQAAVARLGEHALEGASTSELMQEAIEAAGELLDVEIAAVLELLAERRARSRSGRPGWRTLRTALAARRGRLPGRLHGPDRRAR